MRIGLALTRVKTIHADSSIVLDDTLIPPVAGFGASELLTSWLAKIHELTRLRATALATRLTGGDGKAGTTAEVSDYLLLQTLNRYEPLLQHLRRVPTTSPADLYALLLSMAGELSTYVRTESRRPLDSHPAYQHTTPHLCLKPVVDDTHLLLNAVLVRSAQSIALREQGHGMRNAVVDPVDMRGFTAVVLAVHAAMPPDLLQQQFAARAKAGPSERLPDWFVDICRASRCRRCRYRRDRSRSTPALSTTSSRVAVRCGTKWRGTAASHCMSPVISPR